MKSQNAAEVDTRTQNTADHIENTTRWDVSAKTNYNDEERITVYDKDEMNGYTKATVINTVLSECPALEVQTTEEGKTAVTFGFKDE